MKKTTLLPSLFTIAVIGMLSSVSAHAQTLFLDNFTTTAQSDNVNFEYDQGRQTGTLGAIQYTEAGGVDFQHQVRGPSNTPPQVMYVVGTDFNLPSASVSLNQNFNTSPGLGSYQSISFLLDPVLGGAGTSGEWGSFTLGASNADRNKPINDSGTHYGVLFKDDGSYEAFNGSSQVSTGAYSATPTITLVHAIEFRISGLVDGNPFDGSGDAYIQVFADGSLTPFTTYTKTGGYTNNYTTFAAFGGFNITTVDNFQVANVAAVPEVSTWGVGMGVACAMLVVMRRRRANALS